MGTAFAGMHERIRKTGLPDKSPVEVTTAATAGRTLLLMTTAKLNVIQHVLTCPGCAEFEERVYNTHAIVDDKGVLVAKYRKLHLFDGGSWPWRYLGQYSY